MPVTDLFASVRSRLSLSRATLGWALIGAVSIATAQTASQATAPASKPSTPALLAKTSGPTWKSLTPDQKQILKPLAATWDTLSGGHKSKWVALSQNYASRSPAEQEKMQSRMSEWAGLTASQRERARLNFAETKNISPAARAAEWEAYQNLSKQEKQDLSTNSKVKPAGAALAVKPASPSKLTPVPITRHTPRNDTAALAIKPRIDPNTLLPLPPLPPVVVPAATSAPVQAVPSPTQPSVTAESISPN